MADFAEEIEQFLASFSPDETAVMRHAFRAILAGRPTNVAEVPEAVGLSADRAEATLHRLVERGVIVVEPDTGAITGSRGLSLAETCHRLMLDGRKRYAFCAVDAIGIPVALGADARVESLCHQCGQALTLDLKGGAPQGAPQGIVIWAVERDLTRSLRAHTWTLINFFCSVEHLRDWAAGSQRPGRMLTVQEAAALGPRLWGAMLREGE